MNFDGINFPYVEVPLDENDPRFIKNFSLLQSVEINQFFRTYGFVIIRDILTPEECERTIQDIWTYLPPLTRDDPLSWNTWPKTGSERFGMPTYDVVTTQTALDNRLKLNTYKAFETVLSGRETPLLDVENDERLKLFVSHDRYGTMRPSKDLFINGQVKNMPQWKTNYNVHLDMDPWKYFDLLSNELSLNVTKGVLTQLNYSKKSEFIRENNVIHPMLNQSTHLHVQGSIALQDNFEEDGGFVCVPGFHNYLHEWAVSTLGIKHRYLDEENSTAYSIRFSPNHPINKAHIRVSVPQGAAIIWDQRLPHGSGPNNSSNWRYVQYLKMFASESVVGKRATARKNAVLNFLKPLGNDYVDNLSPLAKELLGISS